MKTIDKSEITDNFLEILEQIQSGGEEVLVTEDSQPILKISPYQKSPTTAELFGKMRGKVQYFEDLTQPTVEEWQES
ncbi:prevent-host-death protein [Geitlerinema sp. P-1104]|uniref:type II toxin-antitoxin system Phd/YefM family antitoxin n=1 Tax=Geitlerinema sp. P-1104 TaxID=2546230 RepID=UPI0011FC3F67|nr:prevent-host-death protein [Geitlerinema sp. P-1104]NMG57317.1 prevent-host-death protein [Geitlerinema sp. P-1104]TAO03263.1 MAG: prevent-host-death protein [Phormidium sp. SL48-SHIP]